MKQRDQYKIEIPYDIKDKDDALIPIADVSKVEFIICKLVKEYPSVVTYDSANSKFLFPVTEAESGLFPPGNAPCQMRAHFSDGDIVGSDTVYVKVGECLIKA